MKRKRSCLYICAMLCWWGFLYPQLTMTRDTYEMIYEESGTEIVLSEEEKQNWDFDDDIFEKVSRAEKGKVRLKSKLWQVLEAYFKEISSNE